MARAGASLMVQGTSVSQDGVGVLIRGPSGSGKSDLALRLIDGGALLVADDATWLCRKGDTLVACLPAEAPPACRGRLEIRGLGILPVPCVGEAALGLVVDLRATAAIERLPEPAACSLLGIDLPCVAIDPFTAAAAAKVRLAVRSGRGFIMRPP